VYYQSRLNEQERQLIQYFRLLSVEQKSILLNLADSASQPKYFHDNLIDLASYKSKASF